MSSIPPLASSDFRFHTRGRTAFQDPEPFGSYGETPYLLNALAKALHKELGLGDDEFINGGGMIKFAFPDMEPELDVSFNVVGVKKFGKGEAILYSAFAHGPRGVSAWTPDLDLAKPEKPQPMGYFRREANGQFHSVPLPAPLKAALEALVPQKAKATAKASNAVLCAEGDVLAAQFSPDGLQLAAGDNTGRLHLYDVADGRLLWSLSVGTTGCRVVAFAPDGKTVVAGTNALKEVDAKSGKLVAKLASHGDMIDGLAFSPSGRRIASAGKGKLIVWDRETQSKVYGATIYDVAGLAFIDETHVCASINGWAGFRSFDLSAKAPKHGPAEIQGPNVFGPVRDGWLARHLDRSFVIHDRNTLAPGRVVAFTEGVGSRFATDGDKRFAVTDSDHPSRLLVVDASSGEVLHRLAAQPPTGHGDPLVHGFAFSCEGRLAAYADRGITIWNSDGSLHLAPRAA